mmetsp:Transcript_43109/g.31492  ORF Transcript_43109/g.31492 Transcript_43109/m.31492 type:complete len:310 (+) Transcript_43109:77-1006(+)
MLFCLVVVLVVILVGCAAQNLYTGAVAEINVDMGSEGDSASTKLEKNLDLYTNLVAVAKSKGVQILVFPEFGLVPANQDSRESLYPYAEKIGNVDNNNASVAALPCDDNSYSDRPILQRMSCAARDNGLAVLVNMVDWIDCSSSTDSECPDDGHYQYNTNVVFDESGRLVVKYHKSHEFPSLRKAYDQVPSPSEVTYQSSFGVTFGIFTCFDIMFPDPAVNLRKQGISHFLYPVQQGEIGESTIIQHWSKSQKATLLSANLGAGDDRKGDCSGILLNGDDLPSSKVYLRDFNQQYASSADNLLIASVPF